MLTETRQGSCGDPRTRSTLRRRRGYTLIEMMIVVVILITLIALFAPVIGGARNAARKVATLQLLTNVQTATSSFELDQRRLPGYFTPVQMADTANAMRGFTYLQNMLLDLSGGVTSTGAPSARRIRVGPSGANSVLVDLDLINAPTELKGTTKNVYYTIDKKNWVVQDGAGQKAASVQEHITLPDVVDAFSNPILAWAEDEGATASDPFASVDNATRAKFYWNGNAAFLNAQSLGRGGKDQRFDATESVGSVIGGGMPQEDLKYSMHGLLGHPGFPASLLDANNRTVPAASRAKIVFHSAGSDGVFLSARDRGGLIATSTSTAGGHRRNVVDYLGSKADPLDNFDDIISVAGN